MMEYGSGKNTFNFGADLNQGADPGFIDLWGFEQHFHRFPMNKFMDVNGKEIWLISMSVCSLVQLD